MSFLAGLLLRAEAILQLDQYLPPVQQVSRSNGRRILTAAAHSVWPDEHLPTALARKALALMAGICWNLGEPGTQGVLGDERSSPTSPALSPRRKRGARSRGTLSPSPGLNLWQFNCLAGFESTRRSAPVQ
jgi:hypothetical protein